MAVMQYPSRRIEFLKLGMGVQRQNMQNIVAAVDRKPPTLQLPSRSVMRGVTLTSTSMPSGLWHVGTGKRGAVLYLRADLTTVSITWEMVIMDRGLGGGVRLAMNVFSWQ